MNSRIFNEVLDLPRLGGEESQPSTRSDRRVFNRRVKEEQRRAVAARIDALALSSTAVLQVFKNSAGGNILAPANAHTPIIVVKKGPWSEPARERFGQVDGMAGIKFGIQYNADRVAAGEPVDLDVLRSLQLTERLERIRTMGAYLYRLPFDEKQTVGEPVRTRSRSDQAIREGSEFVHPVRAVRFVAAATASRHENRVDQREFDNEYNYRQEPEAITNFARLADIVLTLPLTVTEPQPHTPELTA